MHHPTASSDVLQQASAEHVDHARPPQTAPTTSASARAESHVHKQPALQNTLVKDLLQAVEHAGSAVEDWVLAQLADVPLAALQPPHKQNATADGKPVGAVVRLAPPPGSQALKPDSMKALLDLLSSHRCLPIITLDMSGNHLDTEAVKCLMQLLNKALTDSTPANIRLAGCKLTAGTFHLADFVRVQDRLERLDLSNNRDWSAGRMEDWKALLNGSPYRQLRMLCLQNTAMTNEGMAMLLAAIAMSPNCGQLGCVMLGPLVDASGTQVAFTEATMAALLAVMRPSGGVRTLVAWGLSSAQQAALAQHWEQVKKRAPHVTQIEDGGVRISSLPRGKLGPEEVWPVTHQLPCSPPAPPRQTDQNQQQAQQMLPHEADSPVRPSEGAQADPVDGGVQLVLTRREDGRVIPFHPFPADSLGRQERQSTARVTSEVAAWHAQAAHPQHGHGPDWISHTARAVRGGVRTGYGSLVSARQGSIKQSHQRQMRDSLDRQQADIVMRAPSNPPPVHLLAERASRAAPGRLPSNPRHPTRREPQLGDRERGVSTADPDDHWQAPGIAQVAQPAAANRPRKRKQQQQRQRQRQQQVALPVVSPSSAKSLSTDHTTSSASGPDHTSHIAPDDAHDGGMSVDGAPAEDEDEEDDGVYDDDDDMFPATDLPEEELRYGRDADKDRQAQASQDGYTTDDDPEGLRPWGFDKRLREAPAGDIFASAVQARRLAGPKVAGDVRAALAELQNKRNAGRRGSAAAGAGGPPASCSPPAGQGGAITQPVLPAGKAKSARRARVTDYVDDSAATDSAEDEDSPEPAAAKRLRTVRPQVSSSSDEGEEGRAATTNGGASSHQSGMCSPSGSASPTPSPADLQPAPVHQPAQPPVSIADCIAAERPAMHGLNSPRLEPHDSSAGGHGAACGGLAGGMQPDPQRLQAAPPLVAGAPRSNELRRLEAFPGDKMRDIHPPNTAKLHTGVTDGVRTRQPPKRFSPEAAGSKGGTKQAQLVAAVSAHTASSMSDSDDELPLARLPAAAGLGHRRPDHPYAEAAPISCGPPLRLDGRVHLTDSVGEPRMGHPSPSTPACDACQMMSSQHQTFAQQPQHSGPEEQAVEVGQQAMQGDTVSDSPGSPRQLASTVSPDNAQLVAGSHAGKDSSCMVEVAKAQTQSSTTPDLKPLFRSHRLPDSAQTGCPTALATAIHASAGQYPACIPDSPEAQPMPDRCPAAASGDPACQAQDVGRAARVHSGMVPTACSGDQDVALAGLVASSSSAGDACIRKWHNSMQEEQPGVQPVQPESDEAAAMPPASAGTGDLTSAALPNSAKSRPAPCMDALAASGTGRDQPAVPETEAGSAVGADAQHVAGTGTALSHLLLSNEYNLNLVIPDSEEQETW